MRHFLKGTIIPKILIDGFIPKSGSDDEVSVICFYATDKEPANDLENFLQRSPLDIIDVDVSPNPDEDGNYLVFVELERNKDLIEQLAFLIREVENLTSKQKWLIKPYLSKKWYDLTDPEFISYVMPESEEKKSDLDEFFNKSNISQVNIQEHIIDMDSILMAEMLDFGDIDMMSSRYKLNESKSPILSGQSQHRVLQDLLGDSYSLTLLGEKVIITNDESSVLVLEDLTIKF